MTRVNQTPLKTVVAGFRDEAQIEASAFAICADSGRQERLGRSATLTIFALLS